MMQYIWLKSLQKCYFHANFWLNHTQASLNFISSYIHVLRVSLNIQLILYGTITVVLINSVKVYITLVMPSPVRSCLLWHAHVCDYLPPHLCLISLIREGQSISDSNVSCVAAKFCNTMFEFRGKKKTGCKRVFQKVHWQLLIIFIIKFVPHSHYHCSI